jgi:hypothetical protein
LGAWLAANALTKGMAYLLSAVAES